MKKYQRLKESIFNIKMSKDLYSNLEKIIELEYKYNYIKNLNLSDKDKLLNVFNKEINPLLKKVISQIQEVYYTWLVNHSDKNSENIKNIKNKIKITYKKLDNTFDNIKDLSFYNKFTTIHKAISEVHSGGYMLDYIASEYDITDDMFNNLSVLDKKFGKKWQAEIKKII